MTSHSTNKLIYWTLATIAVVIFYQLHYGLRTLLPANIDWLMSARHDWGTHYLGWAFYKNEPWTFPLGKVTGYNYPAGTNVGFTDSIPLLAIFFKLFGRALPSDFQYFGLWLFTCHLLAAYWTIALFRRFRVNWPVALLAALFVMTNPVLVYRGMHPALCAHWLLIACIYVYFLDSRPLNKILGYQLLLLAVSAMVNPYICWMVLGFTAATPAKLWLVEKRLHWKKLVAYLGISVFTVLLLWYLTGMIEFGKKEDLGVGGAFGLYAMNLNAFFNSFGYSSFFPRLPWVSPHQYEGYMYLGLGMFLLLAILLACAGYRFIRLRGGGRTGGASARVWAGGARVWAAGERQGSVGSGRGWVSKRLIPLLVLAFVYALIAVPLVFTFNDKVLLRIPVPGLFVRLIEVFRASGRFFWLPYYLIIFAAIMGIARLRIRPAVSTAIVALAFVVQLVDVRSLLGDRHLPHGPYVPPMDNAAWLDLMSRFDVVVSVPAYQPPPIRDMAYQDFCFLALKAGKPIDLAYVPRADSRAMRQFGDSLLRKLYSGQVSPRALYLNGDPSLDNFSLALQTGALGLHCLDGCYFLYSPRVKDPLLDSMTAKLDAVYARTIDSARAASGTKLQFEAPGNMPLLDSGTLHYNMETVRTGRDYLSISGWAMDSTVGYTGDSLYITLSSGNKFYWAHARAFDRPDVNAVFPGLRIRNAGVNFLAFTDSIPKGIYRMGIATKNARGRFVAHSFWDAAAIGTEPADSLFSFAR